MKILNFKKIKSTALTNESIESLSIPSSVVKFEDGWCFKANNLIKVEIDPNNKHFKNYKDELILGKTDENNDVFNAIIFARRDIEKVTIPTFIKKINLHAFSQCNKIKNIEIPSNVSIIDTNAFNNCSNLEAFYYDDNSELRVINLNTFSGTIIALQFLKKVIDVIESKIAFHIQTIKLTINSNNKNLIN